MSNSRAVKLVQPIFPSGFKAPKDKILIRITIDENGDVISAKSVSGNMQLMGYAENAAKGSKFQPAVVCGKPAKITGLIEYIFETRP